MQMPSSAAAKRSRYLSGVKLFNLLQLHTYNIEQEAHYGVG